jgi:hypothetical protein
MKENRDEIKFTLKIKHYIIATSAAQLRGTVTPSHEKLPIRDSVPLKHGATCISNLSLLAINKRKFASVILIQVWISRDRPRGSLMHISELKN